MSFLPPPTEGEILPLASRTRSLDSQVVCSVGDLVQRSPDLPPSPSAGARELEVVLALVSNGGSNTI